MTTIEERSEYLNNPYYERPLYGDFSPFYKTIAVCSVFCAIIFILNIVIGCCSKHRQYWQDRHTGKLAKLQHGMKAVHAFVLCSKWFPILIGFEWFLIGNRWIVSLWTATPHKNPPLDLTELEDVGSFYPKSVSDVIDSCMSIIFY